MKSGPDHLPDAKRRELDFGVNLVREGFAFVIARRTMPRLRGGKLLKIILSEALLAATGSRIGSAAIFPTMNCWSSSTARS